jgi:hypothetical protein
MELYWWFMIDVNDRQQSIEQDLFFIFAPSDEDTDNYMLFFH